MFRPKGKRERGGNKLTTYTPGPWKWHKYESSNWSLYGDDGTKVCDDGSAGGEYNREIDPEGDERNQANAQLIAASPGLLEALKELLEFTRGVCLVPDEEEEIKRAEKAIAQAQEGK